MNQLSILKPKLFYKIIETKQFEDLNLRFASTKNNIHNSSDENLLSYIININFSLTNTLINITDANGNTKKSFSAGYVKLTKKQKRVQPLAVVKIINFLLFKSQFLKHKFVALHFKNVRVYYQKLIIKWLSDKMFIKSIQTFNFLPHNGCRPKKLRRFKRRTKRLVLY